MYRYIGNKTRVLDDLLPILSAGLAPGAVVADLMCGTASVSAALRDRGLRVLAADLMTFAVQHATVRLIIPQPPGFSGLGMDYAEVQRTLNHLPSQSGYFVREYSPAGCPDSGDKPRKYLTPTNAARLDAISGQLSRWTAEGRLTEQERHLLRHDLVLAVNRVANIAGTYGHYRSTFGRSAEQPLALQPSGFRPDNHEGHTVLHGRAEDVAAGLVADLVYLDPPYMKRQYAANYHLIETVARGDEAPAVGVSGLRDWWPQYSDFCSKRKIADAFAAIFNKVDCPRVMVSYSEDGLLPMNQMKELLGEHGQVRIFEFPHVRFRSNSSPLSRNLKEYVFEVSRNL